MCVCVCVYVVRPLALIIAIRCSEAYQLKKPGVLFKVDKVYAEQATLF